MAEEIARNLKKRETHILEASIFLAGVWADARYRILLNEEQKEIAKNTLKSVHRRLIISDCEPKPKVLPASSHAKVLPSSSHVDNEFDRYLDTLETAQPIQRSLPDQLDVAIKKVEQMGRLKCNNVWEIIKMYPEPIREVARVVSAVPCTQVSVERLFSHLRLVRKSTCIH